MSTRMYLFPLPEAGRFHLSKSPISVQSRSAGNFAPRVYRLICPGGTVFGPFHPTCCCVRDPLKPIISAFGLKAVAHSISVNAHFAAGTSIRNASLVNKDMTRTQIPVGFSDLWIFCIATAPKFPFKLW